jgi:hypothetical protein
MGLIVNDIITLDSGLQVTGAYLSFNGGQVINLEYGVSCGLKATVSQVAPPATPVDSPPPANPDEPPDVFANVKYTINGTYSIWASKDAKDRGLKPLQTFPVHYGITSDQISQPPLDLLYQYVKTIYSSVEDDV